MGMIVKLNLAPFNLPRGLILVDFAQKQMLILKTFYIKSKLFSLTLSFSPVKLIDNFTKTFTERSKRYEKLFYGSQQYG